MNILLLNPSTFRISMGPPLGLRYISAILKQNGFDNVAWVDLHQDPASKFELEIMKADIIGIHTVSRMFPEAARIAQTAKGLNPNLKVIIGGPHASLEPEEVVSVEAVDVAVIGEGEYAFLELVKELEKGGGLSGIEGIYYKTDGIIRKNAPRKWIENLDEVPFPDFELFGGHKRYLLWPSYSSAAIAASRSCPYVCTVCQPALKEIIGPYRQRSVKNVIAEINFMTERYGIRKFNFLDNTFTVNRDWVVRFCEELIKRQLRIEWSCAGTVGNVDKELFMQMKKAGCSLIAFGIESGSQYVLNNVLHKRHSIERAREIIREAKEAKLQTHCWFMVGIPGETKEQIFETVEFAKGIGSDSLMFSVVVPQPHAAIEKTSKEKKWILPHQLSDLEKAGLYPFSRFKTDEWLGRSSLFKTDEWAPEFIEDVKERIVRDFDEMGWTREGFTFMNIQTPAQNNFLGYIKRKILYLLNWASRVKRVFKIIGYKIKLICYKMVGGKR